MKQLALLFLPALIITNLLLFALGYRDYAVYIIINSILFILLTLFARTNSLTEKVLRSVCFLLFLGFVYLVVIKIISWL
jgi:hypothetical protein